MKSKHPTRADIQAQNNFYRQALGENKMKIYIAARFSNRHIANGLAHFMKRCGHTITSRWVLPNSDHVIPVGMSEQAADDERRRFAREDLYDLDHCDWCISLMEQPRGNGRGGRHVEFGYALALNKRLFVIGPRETVFHNLDRVEWFQSIAEFKTFIINVGK